MGVELTRAAHAVLPGSGLDKTARFVLVLLADAAKDTTGLCWPSQATLASIIGCAPNYLSVAMGALAAAGMVSTWRRPGRVPLHLIHPAGVATRAPATGGAIRKHLRQGTFTAGDISAVIDWLQSLGWLADTPKMNLGVPRTTPKLTLARPQDDLGPTPMMTLAEPLLNQNETRSAGARPAIVGGLAEPPGDDRPTKADFDALQALLHENTANLRVSKAREAIRVAPRRGA